MWNVRLGMNMKVRSLECRCRPVNGCTAKIQVWKIYQLAKWKKNCAQALFWLHCTQFSDYYMYIRIYARAYAGFILVFFCSNFFFSRSLNLVHKIYSIRASFRKNFNFFPSLTISYCMSYTTIVVRYRFMGARVYVWSTEFFLHCENLFDSIFRMHKLFPVSRSNAIIKQRMSRFMCFCFPL